MEPDTNIAEPINPVATDAADEEVKILDVLILLARRKKMLIRVTVVAAVVAVIYSLLLPKTYTASASFLPPQQSRSGAAAMLANLNPMIQALGAGELSSSIGAENPADLYLGLLKSRAVADTVVNRFGLKQVYESKTDTAARDALAGNSVFAVSKENIIEISVDDHDPKRAAAIANGYIDALQDLTHHLAVSEASQRRLFYQQELASAKQALDEAEVALKETQEKTGLIEPDAQGKAIVESSQLLWAQIAAKEIELQRMRLFGTEQNPDVQGAEQELSSLRAQLANAEQKGITGNGDIRLGTAKVPAVELEYLRRYRNVKYCETTVDLLTGQLESAKLDEANETLIQVVDKASPPEMKSAPKRSFIVIALTLLAFCVAASWILIQEYYERQMKDPERAASVHLLCTYLFGEGKIRLLPWKRRSQPPSEH